MMLKNLVIAIILWNDSMSSTPELAAWANSQTRPNSTPWQIRGTFRVCHKTLTTSNTNLNPNHLPYFFKFFENIKTFWGFFKIFFKNYFVENPEELATPAQPASLLVPLHL